MKKNIDITTTATLRPEILRNTYVLFWKNIFYQYKDQYDFRLIINIDPIGDEKYCQKDILKIAKEFFPNISYNCPSSNNFAKAVKWVWANTSSKYVFHLEDMWKSFTKINLTYLVYILDNYSQIAYVNLHKGTLSDDSYDARFYTYNKKNDKKIFLQIEDPLLSPGLYRGQFVRDVSILMNDIDNPELQIWGDKRTPQDNKASFALRKELESWDYAIYAKNWKFPFWICGYPEVNMFDGRKWKKKQGFYKETPFTPWEKIKDI